jgi:hypothetical protein
MARPYRYMIKQCANINCKNIFRTRDKKRIYCCTECSDEVRKEYNKIYQIEYDKLIKGVN